MRISLLKIFTISIAIGCIASIYTLAASPDKIQTVISQGWGADVQSAAQNAAYNALINVVGSFMDSTKMLEKQVIIQNAVRSRTSKINTHIKEYSQGSIQRFELLQIANEHGLTQVTAKVSVRIEDFRAFIKQLAEGSTRVGTGLFSTLSTGNKQKINLVDIIGDILIPIVKGEVSQLEVGIPLTIEAAKSRLKAQFNWTDGRLAELERAAAKKYPKLAFYIPVVIKLQKNAYANFRQTLENTASGKNRFVHRKNRMLPAYREYGAKKYYDLMMGMAAKPQRNSVNVDIYLLKGIYELLTIKYPWIATIAHGSNGSNFIRKQPLLRIELADTNENIIHIFDLEPENSYNIQNFYYYNPQKDVLLISNNIFNQRPVWSLLALNNSGNDKLPIVLKNIELGIVIAVDESILRNTQAIKVKLVSHL